ncbi:MAG: HDIG domain-containing protein [Thermoleophilia bacterium]|nr:HDIG domain-containing protein [Thermoleophilia bacterium]
MGTYRFFLRERLGLFRDWIDKRTPWRLELALLACLLIGLTVIIGSAYLPTLRSFTEGTAAPETVIAGDTLTVLDAQATEELKAHVAGLAEPVYIRDPQALPRATEDLSTFLQNVERLRIDVAAGGSPQAALPQLRAVAPQRVASTTLEYLIRADSGTYTLISNQALGALNTLYAGRITAESIDTVLLNLRKIADALTASRATADAVYEVTAGYVRPNQLIDEEQTEARRRAATEQVAPVMMTVIEGDTVIQKGVTVTAQDLLILEALGLTSIRSGWKPWVGTFLLMLLEVILFSRLLRRLNKTEEDFGNKMLVVLTLLLLGATLLARLLTIEPLSAYIIPAGALGMVVAVILNARSALLLVALLSLNIGLLTDLDMRYVVVSLLVGGMSLYLVSRVTKRMALLGAGLVSMVLAALTVFIVELFADASVGEALRQCLWGLANGFLVGVLTLSTVMVLETLFNLTTPLRLLELADPAHPLLKKLMQVAPGTYNHSIQMANLAESAAEAIGADPLLARVGAYYHDIGKTVRPDYFVENQIYVDNPHDRLSPSLSKLAITAHVRDGEHLGKVYGLPQPVIDIMKQHHGTSVLAYFYHRAQQGSKEPVYEESYRYEEQKPRSKEASIIMLADSVEAAVRTMENPTRRKIQGLIQEIVKQKVEDGQLDDSALTQRDMHKIVESFDQSLLGLVGHRIRYPDRTERPVRRPADAAGDEK